MKKSCAASTRSRWSAISRRGTTSCRSRIPSNEEFKKKWAAYAKAKKLPGADKPLTNDPMEATYVGIHMWKQAVEKAKSTDTDKVIAAMAGQKFNAPDGFDIKMDEKNHHLWKPVFIGEVQKDGQFNVVWKTKGPIRAQPWSQYIEGNDREEGRAGEEVAAGSAAGSAAGDGFRSLAAARVRFHGVRAMLDR